MTQLDTLKAELEIAQGNAKLWQAKVEQLQLELADLEWEEITWDDLEKELKARPDGGIDDYLNPVVCRKSDRIVGEKTYCRIKKCGEFKGQLQVGPYFDYDRIPRGSSMWIRRDRKPWN